MRTTRQTYLDSNFQAAREAGCDTLQLKLDGWWSRTLIEKGKATVFTRTNRELPAYAFTTYPDITCTIVGELMHGTNWAQTKEIAGKTFAFDIWTVDDVDMSNMPYKDRYGVLRAMLKRLPPSFIRVENFRIQDFDAVWRQFVTEGDYEGVVFRHSKGLLDTPIYRQKSVVVDQYTVQAIEEGEGKFLNMLGAVVCTNGGRVGGGWTDEERIEIFNNQDAYRGKVFEVEGRKRFEETGLLRHPNFVRWL